MKMIMHQRGARPEIWGFIPGFLSEDDPRPAREQIDANYIGGWRPLTKFSFNPLTLMLHYPGDPAMKPISTIQFRDERVILFEHSWVMILRDDGWSVARLD